MSSRNCGSVPRRLGPLCTREKALPNNAACKEIRYNHLAGQKKFIVWNGFQLSIESNTRFVLVLQFVKNNSATLSTNKQLLDEVFVISGIVKVKVSVIRLRLITLTAESRIFNSLLNV